MRWIDNGSTDQLDQRYFRLTPDEGAVIEFASSSVKVVQYLQDTVTLQVEKQTAAKSDAVVAKNKPTAATNDGDTSDNRANSGADDERDTGTDSDDSATTAAAAERQRAERYRVRRAHTLETVPVRANIPHMLCNTRLQNIL